MALKNPTQEEIENITYNPNGNTIVFSNMNGAPRKNISDEDLSYIYGTETFYLVINKFIQKNDNNRVVFIGPFYGVNGTFQMNIIECISILIDNHNEDVKNKKIIVVLAPNDINLLRLKWEFHKDFFLSEKDIPYLNIKLDKMDEFTNKSEEMYDKVYVDKLSDTKTIIVDKSFDSKYINVYIDYLDKRVRSILKTNNCIFPFSLLSHKILSEFYEMAKYEQNSELMILLEKLGSFIYLYTFLPESKSNNKFVNLYEVQNIIEYILKKIRENIDLQKKYRQDKTIQIMNDLCDKIFNLLKDSDEKSFVSYMPTLKYWKKIVNDVFYPNATLISYVGDIKSIFCYDNTLTLFLHYQNIKNYIVENIEPLDIKNYYKSFETIYFNVNSHKELRRTLNPKIVKKGNNNNKSILAGGSLKKKKTII